MSTSQSDFKSKVLSQFREELLSEGILHEGDTIGTDDGTLKQVVDSFNKVSHINPFV